MRKLGTIIDNLKRGQPPPTRHQNPYLTEALELNDYLLTSDELRKRLQQGELFSKKSPLILEIGCYMGKNILEFAEQNPQFNFIGLDITYKRVVKAARKIKRNQVSNAKIAICDGKQFLEEFNLTNSLQGVCVFFPDPWPKDRHEKNRLLNLEFVGLLKEKLSPSGFFWFKTDAKNYFENTEKILLKAGFIPDDENNPCYEQPHNQPKELLGGPYETAFQKIFTQKQVPFYQRVYVK